MANLARAADPAFRPLSFGRYTLLRRIGAGGMGEVYLAKLPGAAGVDKLCVVKKVLPHLTDDTSFHQRFLDEAKVAVQLTHGNICQVFDVGEVEENLYLAMEFVEGKTIGRVAGRCREWQSEFPLPVILFVGARLCDGLAYAHRKTDQSGRPLDVVHRDISPNNVILSYEGEVKIIDFGAAKSTVKEERTAPRLVIGNISYMAPEQARKQHVDRRADIYAGAVVLYELVTGKPIPSHGDFVERWRRAANPKYDPPSAVNPRLPKELDPVILRALSANPDERYADAEEFREELVRLQTTFDPTVSASSVARFMRELFAEELEAERRAVADLMGLAPIPAPAPNVSGSFSRGRSRAGYGSGDPPKDDDDDEQPTDPAADGRRSGWSDKRRRADEEDGGRGAGGGRKTTISRPGRVASDEHRTLPLPTDDDEDEGPTSPESAVLPGRPVRQALAPEERPTIAVSDPEFLRSVRRAPPGSVGVVWYVVAFGGALLLGLGLLLLFAPRGQGVGDAPGTERVDRGRLPGGGGQVAPPTAPGAQVPGTAEPGGQAQPGTAPPSGGQASPGGPGIPGASAGPAPGTEPGKTQSAVGVMEEGSPVDRRLLAADRFIGELSEKYGAERVVLHQRVLSGLRTQRARLGPAADRDQKLADSITAFEGLLEDTMRGFSQER